MSIKKRLLISNILMIALPAVAALVISFGANELFWYICRGYEMVYYRFFRFDYRMAVRFTSYVTVVGVIISVLVVNHYLSKYVIKAIQKPLGILSDGVKRVGEGQLSYRITYETQDEFKKVFDDFNEMAGRLEASVNAIERQEKNRKELIIGISHDIKSPLTSIKAYVEGLLDGVASTPQAQKRYLTIIKEKAEDIDRMVNTLFLFSKMDAGEYVDHPERINIAGELRSIFEAVHDEYMDKGLKISLEAPKDGYVIADPELLHRVFMNIIDNSEKYKDKQDASLSIKMSRCDSGFEISFLDNGPGVPEAALPKLFDVFYRADASRSDPKKGSGVGLAIVKKAIERMGGSVRAANGALGGLLITLYLPEA